MIVWTRRASKDLEKLPDQLKERAKSAIAGLDDNPVGGTKLKGKLTGKRAIRLGRAHRILYEIRDSDVVVLTIAPRRDVYR